MKRERFRAVVAVHLLLLMDDRVLLLRRQNTGYEDGNYSVVAGHLDGNEPATAAMAREALEEVGVIVTRHDLRFVHIMHRREVAEEERIDFFFATRRWQGEPEIREPDKCDELRWAAWDQLPPNVVPYVVKALGEIHRRHPYAEFWPERDAPPEEGAAEGATGGA